MKHLYFVRHGLSEMNKQGVLSGSTDTPLTPEGIEQCKEAGRQLKKVGIDLIVASPVQRAMESAKIIAQELGIDPKQIVINDAFLERDFGPLEGTTYPPKVVLDETVGVEHSRDLVKRVGQGLEFLKSRPEETIVLVSHGAVGRALRHLLNPKVPYHDHAGFSNAQPEKLL